MTKLAAPGRTQPGQGVASRYRALLLTHNSLEEKLAAEMARPMPDLATVQRIKRRKLAIKDEIAAIERLLDAIGAAEVARAAEARPAG